MAGKTLYNILFAPALAALAAACLVAGGGCAKIELGKRPGLGEEEMVFSTYASRTTKTNGSFVPVGQQVLPAGSSFGVFAFYQKGVIGSGTPATWNTGRKPEYMFNEQVSYDGTDYTYDPVRYWPANEENTITFWAYYPFGSYSQNNSSALKLYAQDGTTAYSKQATGLPKASYTVSKTLSEQDDLLFSLPAEDKTYWNCIVNGTVDMQFRHALSLVEFRLAEGTGATIKSMSLTNIKWSGTCANPGASNLVWDSSAAAAEDFSLNNLVVSSSESGAAIATMILMPQTLTLSTEFSLNYDIRFASSDGTEDIVYKGDSLRAKLFKNTGPVDEQYGVTAWEPGHHYIYWISAGLDRIEFEEVIDASADSWTLWTDPYDSSNHDIDVQ